MVKTALLVMRTRLIILLLTIFIINTSNCNAQYLTTLFGVGNSTDEYVYQVEIDTKGNRYFLGGFVDSIDVVPGAQLLTSPNQGSAFLAKLDVNNNLKWVQLLKTTGNDWKMKLNSNDELVVAYSLTSEIIINDSLVTASAGYHDIVVLKFSNDGNLLWCNRMGGAWFEFFVDLQLDQNDNIYICGNYKNPFDADPSGNEVVVSGYGLSSVFVQKFDSNGTMLWVKAIKGEEAQVRDLAIDNSGDVYLLGIFHDSIDVNPDLSIETPMYQSITIVNYNGYILKLTTDGVFDYAYNIGAINDYLKIHIALNSINEVFFIGNGYVNNLYNLDSEGNINLIREIGKPNKMQISEMIIDPSDNFYINGWFSDSVVLVYPFQQESVLCHGVHDGFIQKINESAQLIWAKQIGGYWIDQFSDLEIGTNDELITCGFFEKKALFDEENLTYLTTVPEWSQTDAFVAVYHQHECALWECDIELYPNPTSGVFTIKSSQPFVKSSIQVVDATGRVIINLDNVSGESVNIDISTADYGIYYVFTEAGNEWKAYKILKI